MECVSVQQPEAKASQGGEDQQGQGWRGPGRWAVAVVLAAAGGVVGQPQLVIGLVEGLPTGLFCCATAKVGENPHLTEVHICRQAFVSWLQATGLPVHAAQHRDLVAGVTANVSWKTQVRLEAMGCLTHLG